MEAPRADQPAPTVPAWTRQHEHAFAARIPGQQALAGQPRQRTACVLHHLEQRDAELVDGEPIDLPHLVR